jgi:hypothetical protein
MGHDVRATQCSIINQKINKMKKTFLQVDYDLLSTTKLNSTQKLFVSYIIGWQRNKLKCRETNNTLADKFGMKNSGIRSLLSDLNKFDFFQSVRYDYKESNRTSGHEISVDESKLKSFLSEEIQTKPFVKKVKGIAKIKSKAKTEKSVSDDSTNNKMAKDSSIIQGNVKNYEIVIDTEADITHNNYLLEDYYLKYGMPTDFIKAKIIFENDNEFFVEEVFELKDIKDRCRYVVKGTFELFLKSYKPKEDEVQEEI